MRVSEHVSPVRIFTQTRKKMLSSRGIKQRFIILSLAVQTSNMTRGALSKLLAKEFCIPELNAYHYVLKELEECLIPNGIVEEAGNVPPRRGSRILQRNGIPCYRLTAIGTLIALSLDKLDIEKRKELLENYLATTKILNVDNVDLSEQLLSHLQKYPESTLEMVRDGVFEFINGRLVDPLQIIQSKILVSSKD